MSYREQFKNYLPVIVLGSASVFFLYDIITDVIKGNESNLHLLIEGIIFLATSVILTREILRVVQLRKYLKQEQSKVARLSGELGKVIMNDFDDWKLTNSEKEVAIMLIKGLSMNEIGEQRGVKEKTILSRQQAFIQI